MHAPTSPNWIWESSWSRAMLMAMQSFSSVCSKRWLPMNHRELPKLLEIEFEVSWKKTTRPTIHTASHYSKFSRGNHERTVGATDSVDCKVIWMDYVRNSEEPAHKNYEYANTWFFARKSSLQVATWSKIRRCAGRPKDTPDNVNASCVLSAPAYSPSRDYCSLKTAT